MATDRDIFEAWIKKDCGDLRTFGSGKNMHYLNSAVNNAWTGWQARAALAAPPVEQQAARATVYIQRDHLEKAQRAPFLCRVEPTQRMPDFVPMHPTEQPSQDAALLDWLETMTVNVRTPLRYGSHDLFWATPEERDGEAPRPSDIRTKIAAARAAQAQGEKGKA